MAGGTNPGFPGRAPSGSWEVPTGQFDGVLGNVIGSVFGASPRGAELNTLGEVLTSLGGVVPYHRGLYLTAALTFLQRNGGLAGVLATLREHGFGEQVDTWLGPGMGWSVPQADLVRLFGDSGFDTLAAPLGLSAAEMSDALAQILPELVHYLTPNGQVPAHHAELVAKGLTMLRAASS